MPRPSVPWCAGCLGARVRARWSNLQGKSLFGVGFATPYLGAFRNDACPSAAR